MRRVLVLYWHPDGLVKMRPAVHEHLHALDSVDHDFQLHYENSFGATPAWVRHTEFDAVVLHTTFLTQRWSDSFALFKWRFRWLADTSIPTIALPQDDYDHSEVLDEWLVELGVDDVLTALPNDTELLYPETRRVSRIHGCLTGYIDEAMAADAAAKMRSQERRAVDIVYRASDLPYWFGSQGQQKRVIGDVVKTRAKRLGLRIDISNRYEDTIYGDAWTDFLLSGRCVIGTESGSSVVDRRGELQARIRWLLERQPGASFAEIDAQMPEGWDSHRLFVVSPRHLEAVATRTCQLLVAGRYSGVLEAERHYIPIAPDFSDLDDVLERSRDERMAQAIVDCAYEEIYRSGKYTIRRFAEQLRGVLDGGATPQPTARRALAPLLLAFGPPAGEAVQRGRVVGLSFTRACVRTARVLRAARARRPLVPSPHLASAIASRVSTLRALDDSSTRRLTGRYVVEGVWRTVPPRALARDLLRLVALRRTGEGAVVFDAGRITWQGAAGAVPIDPRRPQLGSLGLPDGRYEFTALAALAIRHPMLVREAFGVAKPQ